MCFILDRMLKNNDIKKWEYTNDRFPYISNDNKLHTYLLDFKVHRNDDTFFYIETKGYIRENDPFKWRAIKGKGIELKILFNDDIKILESDENFLL
jgi:hypothetical protein